MRVIKKYAGRKMYDVENSQFINLEKIADLITAGEEVQVVDERTGSDITSMVLTQIILEHQKKGITPRDWNLFSVPELLRELVKKGTDSVLDFLEKPIFGPLRIISLTEKKAKEIIGKLAKTGKVSTSERDNLLKGLLARIGESKRMLETFIKDTIAHMNIPTRRELEKLRREIKELNERVATIVTK